MKTKHFFILALLVLLASACGSRSKPTVAAAAPDSAAPVSIVAPSENAADPIDCAPAQGETTPISDAFLYVEYNSTDGDLGVHGYLGADGWSELCVYNPSGELMLAVRPQAQLKDVTMATLFFEGREPPLDEFSFEDLTSFPEGRYEVRALSYDGTSIVGEATFTRNLPAPPTLVFPGMADEEGAVDLVLPTDNLVIQWEDVTETTDGGPLTITGYEVIITKVEHEDPNGFSQPIYDVHVGSDHNSLAVSPEFLEAGTLYELEVLALEESGNQTITVSFFTTEDAVANSAETLEFADALALIEYNSSAGDLGFHVALDASAWKWVKVLNPDGNAIFDVTHQGSIGEQGLTSLFFESAELPFYVLPWDEFLARFPEGEYTLVGETIDGEKLMSPMELTHNIPDPPQMISPADGAVLPIDQVLIAWEPVSSPEDVEVDRYQVILFPVDPPEGQDPIALDIDLTFEVPADVTQMLIPAELLLPGDEYQYEVIAIEADGNQTITVGTFKTEA